ncbi:MAG: hypothetical protein IH830_03595 [Planctomycetes bacterium]|nr:hypothetical protein [Planctomycetota bacterium]
MRQGVEHQTDHFVRAACGHTAVEKIRRSGLGGTQHLAQQHDRCKQVIVVDDPPLARFVAGIECPVAVAAGILCPPRGAVD